MRAITSFILMSFFVFNSYGQQKMTGVGGELSVMSLKLNARIWVSKSTGFEIFGGQAVELDDFKPNDLEAGLKFLHTIQYGRTDRTYIGVMGKWKWIDVYESYKTTNLPVPGAFIGKEWFSRRINRKGFAVELGYQYAIKEYEVFSPINNLPIGKKRFEEFPLILNLRYSFYQKR
jgi:hypothetical protein